MSKLQKMINKRARMSLIFILTFALAQIPLSGQDLSDIVDPNGANPSLLWNQKKNSIKGSPYLFENWTSSEIILNKGQFTCEHFNIDLINQLPVINTNNQIVALRALLIDSILVNENGSSRLFIKAVKPGELKLFFPEVLAKGKMYWLLKDLEKEVKEATSKTGYESTKNSNDVPYIIEKTNYYFRDNHELILITKHNLKRNFESIYALAKSAKLNLRLEEDLVELTKLLTTASK